MPWEPLPTNYTDAVWSGLKRYHQIANEDGTVSYVDVTQYSNKDTSFFGALDANRMNAAINTIMSREGNGGLPGGGEAGQLLAKRSATDHDVEWVNAPTGTAVLYTTIIIRAAAWDETKTCMVKAADISPTDYVIISPILRSATQENRQQELAEYSRISQATPLDGNLYLAAFGDNTPSMDLQVFCRIEKITGAQGHCVISGKN